MRPNVLEYLLSQRTCVVAVEMTDGSPHAATVHFAHITDPLALIFKTDRTYRKAEPLLEKKDIRASVVVGTQEDPMKTVQMDGTASLTENPELIKAYYTKFTDKDQKLKENDIFFTFMPTWWRFTDYTLPEGKTVFNSDGEILIFGSK